jgi:hypothetical protein
MRRSENEARGKRIGRPAPNIIVMNTMFIIAEYL